jgi:hypothetical protein
MKRTGKELIVCATSSFRARLGRVGVNYSDNKCDWLPAQRAIEKVC